MCILQDKMGFMWFGTKDGLNRFDGHSFKTFRKMNGVPGTIGNNFILSLYEDNEGVLWVGTNKGMYQYLEKTEQFHLMPATAGLDVKCIQKDNKGDIWFAAGYAFCRYTRQTNKLIYYDQQSYFHATSLCITPDGNIWASTAYGELKHFIPETNSFASVNLFDHAVPVSDRYIETLLCTSDGRLLVGTANAGIKIVDTRNVTYTDVLLPSRGKESLYTRSVIQIGPDEYWLGTEAGIIVYNVKTGNSLQVQKEYNIPFSLSDNVIWALYRDREGGIWAGTYFAGLNYFPKQYTPFSKYFSKKGENSLSGNVAREIKKDQLGNLWIGTEGGGLNKLDPATGRFTHFGPTGASGSISYTNIHGLLVAGNQLWIGMFNRGLDVMDIRTGKVFRHFDAGNSSVLASNFIYCFYQTKAGQVLIGTRLGIYAYNPKKDQIDRLEGFPFWDWYSAILEDEKGTIWTGTFGHGVHCYNPATGQTRTFSSNDSDRNSLCSDRVNGIFEDSQGILWFATEEGLCKWNAPTQNFTRYGTANGFPSDFILSMLEDPEHNLWISTTKGLVRFNPSSGKLRVFTTADGLLSDQFNFSSGFKDSDGRMYFGSAKGLISFNPEQIRENTFFPPVYITALQINNQEIDMQKEGSPLPQSITYTDKIILPHNQSTISIDFAALSYTAPGRVQYAYQMEGLSDKWENLKTNRRVYFTELSPGTYTFRVKASNDEGIWGKETNISIRILPPWWSSPIARGVYVLIGLLLIFLLVRYYHKRVEEKNLRRIEMLEIEKEREILKVEMEKEKEILEAKIEFFTNVAHEIKTPLTLIKFPLSKIIKRAGSMPEIENSLKIMKRNTDRLVELTNQLLDFRQIEMNKLNLYLEHENISRLVAEAWAGFVPLAEQNNSLFDVQIPETPVYAFVDVDAFNKIIYNLFSNAVKYADAKLFIELLPCLKDENSFTIQVSNDGYLIPVELKEKIFQPFYRIPETEMQSGTGIGLALARSLAQLHNGDLLLEPPRDNMNIFSLTLPIDNRRGNERQAPFLHENKSNEKVINEDDDTFG